MTSLDGTISQGPLPWLLMTVPRRKITPESMGESYIGPFHRGMYNRDRLGNKYPVDRWNVRVFSNRDPERLYRPEDVTEAQWKKASIATRTGWARMFPPRRQGVMPEGETERVIRDRENGERKDKRAKQVLAKAAVATLGISSLRPPIATDNINFPPSSDDGITVKGSDSDNIPTERSIKRKQQFAKRRLGRREVKRKGLDTTTMPSSMPNDYGPTLSFPPEDVLTSADEGTTTGGESEGEHVTRRRRMDG